MPTFTILVLTPFHPPERMLMHVFITPSLCFCRTLQFGSRVEPHSAGVMSRAWKSTSRHTCSLPTHPATLLTPTGLRSRVLQAESITAAVSPFRLRTPLQFRRRYWFGPAALHTPSVWISAWSVCHFR